MRLWDVTRIFVIAGNRLSSSSGSAIFKPDNSHKKTSKTKFTDRAFYFAAPMIWNVLSVYTRSAQDLENFRSRLKTELFKNAFS